ncbi:hypothetical protein Emed_007577 [Eimeria media]
MENLGADQRPLPEQEKPGELPEGPSVASHHKDTAASAAARVAAQTGDVCSLRLFVRKPPPVHAPEEPEKGLPVVEEEPKTPPTVHAPEESEKGLPVVEEEPKTPPTVHAPEEPGKELPVVEEEPKKPPPVHAPEEPGKELPVAEAKPEEPPLVTTPGGPGIKPQTGEGEPEAPKAEEEVTERSLPSEFREVVDNIVAWARKQHTDKPLSVSEAVDISLRKDFKRNGVEYTITAYFQSLTPAYDPEKTAADLAKGLPKQFAECKASENGNSTPFTSIMRSFGDSIKGSVTVLVRRSRQQCTEVKPDSKDAWKFRTALIFDDDAG